MTTGKLTLEQMLDLPLPQFRDDLVVYPGPAEEDGSPTYNLFDPIAAQYFKISWTDATILKLLHPGMTMRQLLVEISNKTTISVTAEQLLQFFEDANRSNLTLSFRAGEILWKQKDARKINPLKWLLYHYLYIRIPILSPDKFLTRTLPFVKNLLSSFALKVYLLITLLGLFTLLFNFDQYIHTFTYFFNVEGAIYYALSILSVKFIHEFAHAYVAKYYGVRIPTMGVAFIVLWPVLYTDVTDSWKLASRRQRLAISIAGVASELVLAGLSTLGWALSDAGPLQSVFFIVSSTTWVTSIMINLNPAMRWDGYFLLCDLWGVDNLQPRSFAVTRWWLRKFLWGLNVPPPEENIRGRRLAGFVIYSFFTWIYRLILYTAVAIFVYQMFAKALGIFLFLLEIGVFIVAPFVSEARQVYKLRMHMTRNPRLITSCIIIGLVLLWAILPLPHSQKFPAVTVPVNEQVVYVSQEGVIQEINVKRDEKVVVGQPIIKIYSEEIDNQIREKTVEKNILEQQVRMLGGVEKAKEQIPEKVAELDSTEALLQSLIKKRNLNTLKAHVDGTVYFLDDRLNVGQPVSQDKIIARIGALDNVEIVFFVPEKEIRGIDIGKSASFWPSATTDSWEGTITTIDPSHVTILLYPQLASINGGDLPVVGSETKKTQSVNTQNTAMQMIESYYQVRLRLDEPNKSLRIGQVGNVRYRGEWYSILGRLFSKVFSAFWREGNF